MKKVLFALFALLLVPAVSAQPYDDYGTMVKVGDVAPDFEVEMFDGSTIKLSQLKGKVVLVNFWASWCPYCRIELAVVEQQIIEYYADKDFVFLTISTDDTKEAVAEFRERKDYQFPMGLDPGRKIMHLYGEEGIPRNFVIDQDGNIVAGDVGYSPKQFNALKEEIDRTLNKSR